MEHEDNSSRDECRCGKTASFGNPKNRRRVSCKDCKQPDHINLAVRLCHCGKQAIFGDPITLAKETCEDHKLPGYISLTHVKKPELICHYNGCDKYASFSLPGNKPLYCSKHKLRSHINVRTKKCYCGKPASFGLLPNNKLTCRDHKLNGYVRLGGKKCPCGNTPSYGPPGGVRVACAKCRLPEHVNIHDWRIKHLN